MNGFCCGLSSSSSILLMITSPELVLRVSRLSLLSLLLLISDSGATGVTCFATFLIFSIGFETTFFGFTGSAYDSIDDYDRDANLLSDLDSSFGFSGFCFCFGSVYFFDSGFCLSLSVFFYAIFSVASGGDGVAYFDSFSFGFLSVFEGTDAFLGIGLDFTSN